MKDLNIVAMGKEHIEDVLEIEKLSFSIQWSREAFVQEVLHNKLARYIVILEDNRAIAYGGMWFILDEAHITNIAVHPDFRGQGLGKELVATLIDLARLEGIEQMTLEVRRSNQAAIALYESFGFETLGLRKEFYFDNKEDALIMWKRE